MKTITNSKIGYNGRLGNQLFQFASLFGLAMDTDRSLLIPNQNKENKVENFFDGKQRHVNFCVDEVFPLVKSSLWNADYLKSNFKTIKEKRFTYDPQILHYCNNDFNINLDGFFQSPFYFNHHRKDLLNILSESSERIKREIPLVSVHVRRGDYLNLDHLHPPLGMEYYSKAINFFHGCHFKIFSDDIDWCKNNFPDEAHGFYFSENETEGQDLIEMSFCDHQIIANSTFSWWGAYLCQNNDKCVVAPSRWFGRGYSQNDTNEILSIATKII